jgi:hypothetical protein
MGGFHEPYLSLQGDSDDGDEDGDEEDRDEDEDKEEEEEDKEDEDDEEEEKYSAGVANDGEAEPESHNILNFDFMDLGDGAVADGTQGGGPEGSTKVDRSVEILA